MDDLKPTAYEVDYLHHWLRQPENVDCLNWLTRDNFVNYRVGTVIDKDFWFQKPCLEQKKIMHQILSNNPYGISWKYISYALQILWREYFNAEHQYNTYGKII